MKIPMPLCPVCLAPIYCNDEVPTVRAHLDGIGKTCPMSGKDLPMWDERSTRLAVHGRSGGICERCRMRRATDMHHRMSRGVGGWWSPANIVHLCRYCHTDADDIDWAYSQGVCLRHSQDPNRVPMLCADGTLLHLTDEVAA